MTTPVVRHVLIVLASLYLGTVLGLWMGDGPPPGIMLPLILGLACACVSFLTWTGLKASEDR